MVAGKGCGAGLWSCFWGIVLVLSGQGPDMPSAATPFAADDGGAGGAAPPFVGVWKCGAGYVCPFEGVACTRGCGGGEDFVGEWPALYAEAEGGGKDVIGL